MKQKALEIALEKVPPHPSPHAELEQYRTPAPVAAEILYIAHAHGDIEGKRIIDLGCGTGMLAIGAALLGAKDVIGVDVDEQSVRIAHRIAQEKGLSIDFYVMDISELKEQGDTVVMNPPFGCQVPHADMPFLEKALELCPVSYSLHSTQSEEFIRQSAKRLNATVTFEKRFTYEILHTFEFHRKDRMEFQATLFRIERALKGPLTGMPKKKDAARRPNKK
jgi:putative methylase